MKSIFRFSERPNFENPSLIVGWEQDSGKLSPKVIEYLNKKFKSKSFCEIEPMDFFSLAGVVIENDVAQFPEGKFYYSQRNDLVIFKGNEPRFERYRFLNAIADLAQSYCKIKELYTISATSSPIAHTSPRRISVVFNQHQIPESLRGYGLQDMNWQGPPAISSYLLWVAKNRGIPGVSLWPEIPFYLAAGEDFQAIKLTLSFLDKKFNLGLDLAELDENIRDQNIKIDQLREEDSEINKYIGMLESELPLSEAEQVELTMKVTELLEKKG
ncbi:MAG TPA: PAC2 family protein [Sedimentisphaerales bacterium]|nr:PAC2 family protein [Sedimentisphaerales bacterium]